MHKGYPYNCGFEFFLGFWLDLNSCMKDSVKTSEVANPMIATVKNTMASKSLIIPEPLGRELLQKISVEFGGIQRKKECEYNCCDKSG